MYFEVYLSLTITRNATLVIKYNETVLRIYTSMFRPKIEHFRHGISSSVISSSALGQYLIRTKLKLGADVSTDDQHLKEVFRSRVRSSANISDQ